MNSKWMQHELQERVHVVTEPRVRGKRWAVGRQQPVGPDGLLAVVRAEGPAAGQAFLQDDPQAEHVEAAAHRLALVEGLGRDAPCGCELLP